MTQHRTPLYSTTIPVTGGDQLTAPPPAVVMRTLAVYLRPISPGQAGTATGCEKAVPAVKGTTTEAPGGRNSTAPGRVLVGRFGPATPRYRAPRQPTHEDRSGAQVAVVPSQLKVTLPPMDGGRILISLLPHNLAMKYAQVEPYGFFIMIALIYFKVLAYWVLPMMWIGKAAISLIASPLSFLLT